jgi:hypothetical protein
MRFNDLIVLSLLLFLFLSACSADDEPTAFAERDLTLAGGWSLAGGSTNLGERADDLASRLSADQLDLLGYASAQEYAEDMRLLAAFIGAGSAPCVANDAVIFEPGGTVAIDYSDDCPNGSIYISLFDEGQRYTWSLQTDLLSITEVDPVTPIVRTYQVEQLTTTELSLGETEAGRYDLLFDSEEIGAVDLSDIFITYQFTAR